MIVIPEKSSHWYTRDGKPCHTVPKKGGGERSTNVKDAREKGLLPSVTSILAILNRPSLNVWLQCQAVLASLTLPRKEDESLDSFAQRAVEDAEQQSKKASTFGTSIHGETEKIHLGRTDFEKDLRPYIEGYQRWFDKNVKEVISAEIVLVNDEVGYAGTSDLIYVDKKDRRCVLDTKTQGVKLRPKTYNEWLLQLAAYGEAYDPDSTGNLVLQSMVINSQKPDEPFFHEWPEEAYVQAWLSFLAAHQIWCWQKNYFPLSQNKMLTMVGE